MFTGRELLDAAQVLVLSETGLVQEIVPLEDAGDNVQYLEGWLVPGLVNCHCHLELSHLQGLLPEKTGLVDFVMAVMKQRHFPEAEILAAAAGAEQAMLQEGIVAVGDICNTAHTLPLKKAQQLRYRNFIEVSGFVPQLAANRFQQAAAVYQQFAAVPELAAYTSMVPHAPYSVSPDLFELINTHSAGKLITMHNQETLAEETFFLDGNSDFRRLYNAFGIDISFYAAPGKTSLQACLPRLNKTGSLLLVHNTFTSQQDIVFAQAQHSAALFWTLCVNANQYIEQRMPPVDLLRQQGCTIALGTDSLASNHRLSLLDEMKTIARHFPHIPLTEILQWATYNGAQALGMDAVLGSFEKGKQPGVVCISGIQQNVLLPDATVRRIV